MKHILFTAFLTALVSSLALAQTEQSSKFIGGAFQVSTESSSEGSSVTSFGISPEFGYFIKDQWAIGSGLGFSVYDRDETTFTFSISPFTRYYVPVVAEKFFIYGEAELEAAFGSERSFFGLHAKPGFAFFPTKRWSIELDFSLLDFSINNPEGEDNNTTSFSFGVSTFPTSLGVKFFF